MGQFGLVSIDVGTIGFTLINTAIIVLGYYFLLHKKVIVIFEKRTAQISEDLDSAEQSRAEAKKLEDKYAGLIQGGREEANGIVAAAHQRASDEEARLIGEAQEKAAAIRKRAEEDAEQAAVNARDEVKSQLADLVIAAAQAVTASEIDSKKNEKIIDGFLAQI